MKLLTALLALLMLALLAACGGDDDGNSGDEEFRQVLASMTLQISDVPAGMQSLGPAYSTNKDAASGLGSGPTEEQLDAWGRILGYKSDFQASAPVDDSAVTAVSSSVSMYTTAQGASDSFTDRVATARRVDWGTSHSDLSEFEQKELERDLGVDDMLWLHFTGYKEIGPGDKRLISDDQIVFRIDRAWGFTGAVSTGAKGVEDRDFILQSLETLVRTQVQHMRDGLQSDALD